MGSGPGTFKQMGIAQATVTRQDDPKKSVNFNVSGPATVVVNSGQLVGWTPTARTCCGLQVETSRTSRMSRRSATRQVTSPLRSTQADRRPRTPSRATGPTYARPWGLNRGHIW